MDIKWKEPSETLAATYAAVAAQRGQEFAAATVLIESADLEGKPDTVTNRVEALKTKPLGDAMRTQIDLVKKTLPKPKPKNSGGDPYAEATKAAAAHKAKKEKAKATPPAPPPPAPLAREEKILSDPPANKRGN